MQLDPVDRLLRAALISDQEFVITLRRIMKAELRINVRTLSEISGIAQSSLYKILDGKRSPNLTTVRRICRAIRSFSRTQEGQFIGVIAARPVLEGIVERITEVDGHTVRVREYPVQTVEDAIVAGVRAEREGAIGIVCAPIVSGPIEQLVSIPVATIVPRESMVLAIERAARKGWH
jgi:predicted transcriptional regulator